MTIDWAESAPSVAEAPVFTWGGGFELVVTEPSEARLYVVPAEVRDYVVAPDEDRP